MAFAVCTVFHVNLKPSVRSHRAAANDIVEFGAGPQEVVAATLVN